MSGDRSWHGCCSSSVVASQRKNASNGEQREIHALRLSRACTGLSGSARRNSVLRVARTASIRRERNRSGPVGTDTQDSRRIRSAVRSAAARRIRRVARRRSGASRQRAEAPARRARHGLRADMCKRRRRSSSQSSTRSRRNAISHSYSGLRPPGFSNCKQRCGRRPFFCPAPGKSGGVTRGETESSVAAHCAGGCLFIGACAPTAQRSRRRAVRTSSDAWCDGAFGPKFRLRGPKASSRR